MMFFEFEIMAFIGLIIGLWMWLSVKFVISQLFMNGPEFYIKTAGVKDAKDQLTRNHADANAYASLFYDVSINIFILESANLGNVVISDAQRGIVNQLFVMNCIQFLVFLILKVLSQEGTDHQ